MTITLGHLSEENQKIKNALKKFSGQLHELIDQQLTTWNLSASDKDISRLIVTGKQIGRAHV